MLDGRSIRDMLVTDYSALTHSFFYSTVWLTGKVRKTNVTQRQELPPSDPTTAAASRAKLGEATPTPTVSPTSLLRIGSSCFCTFWLWCYILLHRSSTPQTHVQQTEARRGAAPAPSLPECCTVHVRAEQELIQGSSNFKTKHTHQPKEPWGGWGSTTQHCTGLEPFRDSQRPQMITKLV